MSFLTSVENDGLSLRLALQVLHAVDKADGSFANCHPSLVATFREWNRAYELGRAGATTAASPLLARGVLTQRDRPNYPLPVTNTPLNPTTPDSPSPVCTPTRGSPHPPFYMSPNATRLAQAIVDSRSSSPSAGRSSAAAHTVPARAPPARPTRAPLTQPARVPLTQPAHVPLNQPAHVPLNQPNYVEQYILPADVDYSFLFDDVVDLDPEPESTLSVNHSNGASNAPSTSSGPLVPATVPATFVVPTRGPGNGRSSPLSEPYLPSVRPISVDGFVYGTFYVVLEGRKPGIYIDWEGAKVATQGVTNNRVVKKRSWREAIAFHYAIGGVRAE